MTSGSSADEFSVSAEREQAFQELLKGARLLRGWSQVEAEKEAEQLGFKLNQNLISSLERGPYQGMRLWDISKMCRLYGISVQQVLDTLGWSDEKPESKLRRRLSLIEEALRDVGDDDAEAILKVVEYCLMGMRHLAE